MALLLLLVSRFSSMWMCLFHVVLHKMVRAYKSNLKQFLRTTAPALFSTYLDSASRDRQLTFVKEAASDAHFYVSACELVTGLL